MAKKAAKNLRVTDQLRKLIKECGLSRYRICKEIGLDQASMTRFMQRTGGISSEKLDLLGALLGLEISMHGPQLDDKEQKAKRQKEQ